MRLPLFPTVMTALCVAVLIALGTWQIQRLHWKDSIIERLQAGYAAGENAAPMTPAQLDTLSTKDMPLAYGAVGGKLLRDKAIFLGPRTLNGRIGYHLLAPVQIEGGHILIADLGWVSDLWKDDPEERLALLPVDPLTLRGLMRKADWTSFTSKNSPENDLWFRADVAQIAKAKDLPAPYPFLIYAEDSSQALSDITMNERGWLPRNKHMQYALFWYALAGVLLIIYGVYVRKYTNT